MPLLPIFVVVEIDVLCNLLFIASIYIICHYCYYSGEHPTLGPGQSFVYMSKTLLPGKQGGTMSGCFLFTDSATGKKVEAKIAVTPLTNEIFDIGY